MIFVGAYPCVSHIYAVCAHYVRHMLAQNALSVTKSSYVAISLSLQSLTFTQPSLRKTRIRVIHFHLGFRAER